MKARWLFSKVSNEKGHALVIAQALLLALKLMMSASKDKPHEAEVLTQLSHVHLRENIQGTIGCTHNSVPMVFIVFSRDSWGL